MGGEPAYDLLYYQHGRMFGQDVYVCLSWSTFLQDMLEHPCSNANALNLLNVHESKIARFVKSSMVRFGRYHEQNSVSSCDLVCDSDHLFRVTWKRFCLGIFHERHLDVEIRLIFPAWLKRLFWTV